MLTFYRGLKDLYDPSKHGEGIYFATDARIILHGGDPYSGSVDRISEMQIDTLFLQPLHIIVSENVTVNEVNLV